MLWLKTTLYDQLHHPFQQSSSTVLPGVALVVMVVVLVLVMVVVVVLMMVVVVALAVAVAACRTVTLLAIVYLKDSSRATS